LSCHQICKEALNYFFSLTDDGEDEIKHSSFRFGINVTATMENISVPGGKLGRFESTADFFVYIASISLACGNFFLKMRKIFLFGIPGYPQFPAAGKLDIMQHFKMLET
jgi:hypothetical protein